MKQQKNMMLYVNLFWMAGIFVLNYFYQKNGFDFSLKCITSAAFVVQGILNLLYARSVKKPDLRFDISMTLGLFLACMGDVLIGYDFIVGAATFAAGHICFVIAYGFLQRVRLSDAGISGVLFCGAACFLLFSPLLTFEVPVFRAVCVVYALIISAMLGKAAGNCLREPGLCTGVLAAASALFFFSDLMLVFDWFIGRWDWTDHACMGTYYPALTLMALGMLLHTQKPVSAADR